MESRRVAASMPPTGGPSPTPLGSYRIPMTQLAMQAEGSELMPLAAEARPHHWEAKWMVTFADLITLLFCFFVYLSLFNKPQVDIRTGFAVSEVTLSSLKDRLPEEIISGFKSMKGVFFERRDTFAERLETLIGQKKTSLHKTQILIAVSYTHLTLPTKA